MLKKLRNWIILFVIFSLTFLCSYFLNDFDTDTYMTEKRDVFVDDQTYQNQHPTALRVHIVVYFYPNIKPRPTARVFYFAKYSSPTINMADEFESTIRYFLFDYSKSKGFIGAPNYYIKQREPKVLSTASPEYKTEVAQGLDFGYLKNWLSYRVEVEFNP